MNIAMQINEVIRELRSSGESHTVVLRQTYPTTPTDLWNACTDPARLPRWFANVDGDLREGGRYQLTGINTSGTITECQPPTNLRVTWEYEQDVSHVTLTITGTDSGATLTLEHLVPDNDHWRTYGPGATGAGWDGSFLALALHIADDPRATPDAMAAFGATPEGIAFLNASVAAWEQAHIAAGADPEAAQQAAARTGAAYRGEEAAS